MKPRHKKLIAITGGVSMLVVAGLLVLNAFRSNIVYFFSPSEIFFSPRDVAAGKVPAQGGFRLGGVIEIPTAGDGPIRELTVTDPDNKAGMTLRYSGALPNPPAAGQCVMARGKLLPDGSFQAETLNLVERAVLDKKAPVQEVFRVGGLVEAGSIRKIPDSLKVEFTVTDLAERTVLQYEGILPDLFREGQGVIAQGRLQADGRFKADQVLAKHDEKYMPPEVAKSLKHAPGAMPPARP